MKGEKEEKERRWEGRREGGRGIRRKRRKGGKEEVSVFVLSLHAQAIPGCGVTLSVITVFAFTSMTRQFTQGHLPGKTLWDMEVTVHLAQAGKDSGGVLIVSSLSSHQRGLG